MTTCTRHKSPLPAVMIMAAGIPMYALAWPDARFKLYAYSNKNFTDN